MAIGKYYLHKTLLFPSHTASHEHLLRAGRRRVGVHFRGGSKGRNTRTWISKQKSGLKKKNVVVRKGTTRAPGFPNKFQKPKWISKEKNKWWFTRRNTRTCCASHPGTQPYGELN
jgi:hypothetical protein